MPLLAMAFLRGWSEVLLVGTSEPGPGEQEATTAAAARNSAECPTDGISGRQVAASAVCVLPEEY